MTGNQNQMSIFFRRDQFCITACNMPSIKFSHQLAMQPGEQYSVN